MSSVKRIKAALVGGFAVLGLLYTASSSLSRPAYPGDQKKAQPAATAKYSPEDFVGSETCKACHEEQHSSFAKTAHAKLAKAGWKTETQGCESCHGPGKAHVEGGGDKTKIRTFENESPKQISEACLRCHAGKEEHNNYKRGEHWRNDVACTDCHSPHFSTRLAAKLAGTPQGKADAPSSLMPVGPFPAHSNDLAPPKMLVKNEPQLCLTCHNEMKAQFTQPFHHRVLEGAMKCSDCHNPHGGFEAKQARLNTGADAACMKCHADKQGPFVFEHAPSKVEGCAICHTPHGASNSKMLKRSNVNQLCLECHSNVALKVGEIDAPGAPSFHNQATVRYQNCTTCHSKIHGSNTNKDYFR
jgi:predicted CXXCH cytochrome family protein